MGQAELFEIETATSPPKKRIYYKGKGGMFTNKHDSEMYQLKDALKKEKIVSNYWKTKALHLQEIVSQKTN